MTAAKLAEAIEQENPQKLVLMSKMQSQSLVQERA
jgi:hypothetical protein